MVMVVDCTTGIVAIKHISRQTFAVNLKRTFFSYKPLAYKLAELQNIDR